MVKRLPTMWETWVQFLCQEDLLEKEMATHSSTLAWKNHERRSLVGYSPWGRKESDTTEWLHYPIPRRCLPQHGGLTYRCHKNWPNKWCERQKMHWGKKYWKESACVLTVFSSLFWLSVFFVYFFTISMDYFYNWKKTNAKTNQVFLFTNSSVSPIWKLWGLFSYCWQLLFYWSQKVILFPILKIQF